MTNQRDLRWVAPPHTLVKHEILRRYLSAWFSIMGVRVDRCLYIDGFAGPGSYLDGEPGSPIAALNAARNSRAASREVLFWFLEQDPEVLQLLQETLRGERLPATFRIFAECGSFEERVTELLERNRVEHGRMVPTFAFIDPFGFSDTPYEVISRLLRNPSCEVFLTFMTSYANRFVNHPEDSIRQQVTRLFGTEEAAEIVQQCHGPDRIDALRDLYQRQLSAVARFVRFFEMRNRQNRTIYHLFFASNSPLGHVKMKEAMWNADPLGTFSFSDATAREQAVLFESDPATSLLPLIQSRFTGATVPAGDVTRFVNDETPFIRTHMLAALRAARSSGGVTSFL